MKKHLLYLLLFASTVVTNYAQLNLVPNPSFEDTVGNNCFVQMAIDNSPFTTIHYQKNWCTYKNMAIDYYNYCANFFPGNPYPVAATIPQNCYGYQYPHTGNGYIGILLYAINNLPDSSAIDLEIAVVRLAQPLQKGHCYYGEFYYSLSNINAISINRLGMLLSANVNTLVPFVFDNAAQPQIQYDTTQVLTDTLNWVKISGKFIANGGEDFLSIGNFRDGAHVKKKFITTNFVSPCNILNHEKATFVYIDDIVLYELPKPNLGNDINTCGTKTDSLQIGDATLTNNGLNVHWWLREPQPPSGPQPPNTLLPNLTNTISVSATKTATYIMEYEGCTADTVIVNYKPHCPLLSDSVLVIPNVITPNGDGINDVWQFTLPQGYTLSALHIYNRWGTPILNDKLELKNTVLWDGRSTSGEPCSAGVYYYVMVTNDGATYNGYISVFK